MTTGRRYFIVLEGTDGSGKTSLRKYVFRRLRDAGADVLAIVPQSWHVKAATETIVRTKFFSKHAPSEKITWAFAEDKVDLSQRIIEPHLTCRHVVCDRFIASDMVYHEVMYGIPQAVTLAAYKDRPIKYPDFTVFVDTPPDLAFARVQKRGTGGKHAWDTLDIQRQLHANFRALFADPPSSFGTIVRIDNGGTEQEAISCIEEGLIRSHLLADTVAK